MVPEKGTRARHGDLQFWHQRRRAVDSACRALDYARLGLAVGFRFDGTHGVLLDGVVDESVPHTRGTSEARAGRACAHSKRSPRTYRHDSVAQAVPPSSDMGICARQTLDRSDLVALPVLDP